MTLWELEKQVSEQKNKIHYNPSFDIKNDVLYSYKGDKDVTSLSLPEGIKHIESNAIKDLDIKTLILPQSLVSIGPEAIKNLHYLTFIEIGKNVENIGSDLLVNCENLININVDESNEIYESIEGVLYTENGRHLVRFPEGKGGEVKIKEGVTGLRGGAFENCKKVTSIILPSTLKTLSSYAFKNCINLTSLTIPPLVQKLNPLIFYGCKGMEKINVDINNSYYTSKDDVLLTKDEKDLIYIPENRTREYILPTSIKKIEKDAFLKVRLESLVIKEPSNIETMFIRSDTRLFSDEIKSISFKNKETKIKVEWFLLDPYYPDYTYIKSLVKGFYPSSLDDSLHLLLIDEVAKYLINKDGEEDWQKEWTSFIKENIKLYKKVIFNSKYLLPFLIKNELLTLKDTLYLIEKSYNIENSEIIASLLQYQNDHFSLNDVLNEKEKETQKALNINESIKEFCYIIKDDDSVVITKYLDKKEKHVLVPSVIEGKEVNEIKDEAFINFERITSVILPPSIKKIGKKAFYNCKKLKDITFPTSLKEIGPYAFSYTEISSFILPETLEKIGEGAFSNCPSIITFTTPPLIKEITPFTFSSCINLQEVTLTKNILKVTKYSFKDNYNLTKVIIENENCNIESSSFFNNGHLIIYAKKGSKIERFSYKEQIKFSPL